MRDSSVDCKLREIEDAIIATLEYYRVSELQDNHELIVERNNLLKLYDNE